MFLEFLHKLCKVDTLQNITESYNNQPNLDFRKS